MPRYETLYIAQPGLVEAEALSQAFEQVVTSGEGTVIKSACWGKRKLAYAVRKHQEGVYFHLQFDAPPQVVAELERRLRNHEDVLKYLSVRLDRTAVEALAVAEKKAEERAAARAQREAERAARQKETEAAAGRATRGSARQKPPVETVPPPDAVVVGGGEETAGSPEPAADGEGTDAAPGAGGESTDN